MNNDDATTMKIVQFLATVDSRYCGRPRGGGGEDLVSVIARVRNSGIREKKNCFLSKVKKCYVKVPEAL